MDLLPYQQRILDEETELNKKLVSLVMFRQTNNYAILPETEKQLLTQQCVLMAEYSAILKARISNFGG